MNKKTKFWESLNFWYITLGIVSIILIVIYFIEPIYESIRAVAMSIGTGVLSAVILGIIIEKINKKQVINSRCSLLKSSVSIARETIAELDNVCKELRKGVDLKSDFINEADFSKKAMNLYLSLAKKRTSACDKKAEMLRSTILDIILNRTFIVEYCRNAIYIFNEIVASKNFLIALQYMTENEIKTFEMAQSRMSTFVKETEEQKCCILLTNALNYREQLEKISNFNDDLPN